MAQKYMLRGKYDKPFSEKITYFPQFTTEYWITSAQVKTQMVGEAENKQAVSLKVSPISKWWNQAASLNCFSPD